MPYIDNGRETLIWDDYPSSAAYRDELEPSQALASIDDVIAGDELGFSFKVPMPKALRAPFEAKLSAQTGKKVKLSKKATITHEHLLKAAAGVAAVAATAGAGAALSVPTASGAAGMIGADKLVAAAEKGGKAAQAAKNVYARTKALAASDPDAARALGILSYVSKLRSKAGIPKGQPTSSVKLTPAQTKSITKRVRVIVKPKVPATGNWTELQFRVWLGDLIRKYPSKDPRRVSSRGRVALVRELNRSRAQHALGPLTLAQLAAVAQGKTVPAASTATTAPTGTPGYFVNTSGVVSTGRFRKAG